MALAGMTFGIDRQPSGWWRDWAEALTCGQRVLDTGCGVGEDTRELARLVAPDGEAVGIDLSEALLAEAARRNESPSATFIHADVIELPFQDASFDAYRAERLHQHLSNPQAAMSEAARVLRRGGRIAILDQDWDSILVDADDRTLTREIAHAFCDSFANGCSGRLPAAQASEDVARAVLLQALTPAGHAAGIDEQQLARWLAEQNDRIQTGRFFLSVSFVLASGTRR